MLEQIPGVGPITVGGDKGFDTQEFVDECRRMKVTPHVTRNEGMRGGSAIDARTARHAVYPASQKKRKRIEECFGWLKDVALLRKLNISASSTLVGSLPSRQQPTSSCG
jgi:hypothetical protein